MTTRYAQSLFGIFLFFSGYPAVAQLTGEQTGVATEALQHNFDDIVSFATAHGQLCAKTLKQLTPGVRGAQLELEVVPMNMAGITTSRWKQQVARPDGSKPLNWQFECVSQLRPKRQVVVVSLVMYEQRGAEQRGIELLTNRDVRLILETR